MKKLRNKRLTLTNEGARLALGLPIAFRFGIIAQVTVAALYSCRN